jgi:hypothetical protein
MSERYTTSGLSLPGRRRRAAPDWSQRPAPPPAPPAPKSISQLLAERDFAARVATINPTPKNRLADRAACAALNQARHKAAVEFGIPYSWRSGKGFQLEDLCGFHNSRLRYRSVRGPHEMFDHPWFFRWAKGGRNEGRPSAIVAQPYSAGFDLDEARAFAQENGLVVHVANLFESWYSPGMCTIVVWERADPRRQEPTGARWSPGPWTKR